jgi:hypothetical protein
MKTPVALFVFNRPQLTAQVYARIREAKPQKLLVVADGPRRHRPGEDRLCEQTRALVTSPDWPCEVVTNFSELNLGCRRRLSSGLNWVFEREDRAIVLEDDCLPSPSFFTFCDELLDYYSNDERVMHISGDNWQDGQLRGDCSYYFSRYTLSWGWASWRRAWKHFDVDMLQWPAAYRERWMQSIIEGTAEATFWESVFDKLYRRQMDTWDYQWLFACWRGGGLAIHPNQNLVTNIGAGPDALHFKDAGSTIGLPTKELGPLTHPTAVGRDDLADRYVFDKHINVRTPQPPPASLFGALQRRIMLRTRLRALTPRFLRYRL